MPETALEQISDLQLRTSRSILYGQAHLPDENAGTGVEKGPQPEPIPDIPRLLPPKPSIYLLHGKSVLIRSHRLRILQDIAQVPDILHRQRTEAQIRTLRQAHRAAPPFFGYT